MFKTYYQILVSFLKVIGKLNSLKYVKIQYL